MASKDFDPIAIAMEICNKEAFKTEVFSGVYPGEGTPEEVKSVWDEKVEALANSFLGDYNLEKDQQDQVIGCIFPFSLRMLTLIEYYAGTFNLPRDFCIGFIEQSFFTSKGIIDHQRIRTKLLKESLNNLQRFQLATYYCDFNVIPKFYGKLSAEEKKLLYNDDPELIKQPDIIKFWSYYIRGEIDRLREDDRIDLYRIKTAIVSGSQLAVNYCLGRTKSKQSYAIDIAASIFRHRMYIEITCGGYMNTVDDWIIFRKKRYNSAEDYWVPHSFYSDMFYTLFANMNDGQKKDFWNQVFDKRFIITEIKPNREDYAGLLDYFLCWPHQEMFPELLKTSWHQIPFQVFNTFLQKLPKRFQPKKGEIFYGEEKFYDYRKLSIDEWTNCSQVVKRYLHRRDRIEMLSLFESVYRLKTFTEMDNEFIKLILESALELEKCYYILSNIGFLICLRFLEEKKYDWFDELVSLCFGHPVKARDYKLRVMVTKAIRMKILTLLKNERWDEADEVLKWSGYPLSEEEISDLKSILILHNDGKDACIEVWKTDPAKADRLIQWGFPSNLANYKYRLIYTDIAQEVCRKLCIVDTEKADSFISWCLRPDLIPGFKVLLIEQIDSLCMCSKFVLKEGTPELADKLLAWCLPEERIEDFKKDMGFSKIEAFPEYISTIEDIENCSDEDFPDKIFDWEPAQKMFEWCFNSDPEDIKALKEKYVRNNRRAVLYKSIKTNNWNVADRYLSWLKLDEIEIRMLKKEQIGSDGETRDYFTKLLSKNENHEIYAKGGGKQRTIERFLHWFLVEDGSTVNMFLRWLERFRDDDKIEDILTKMKSKDNVEAIREVLKTF